MEEEKAKEEDAKAVKANQHPLRTVGSTVFFFLSGATIIDVNGQ